MNRSSSRNLAQNTAPPAIRVSDVWKRYPGVVALGGVTMSVAPGEVRALLGKNGAGKSTLVEVMSGSVRPDRGGIEIDGRDVQLGTPAAARACGIATVHQELTVVPELSVAENVFLGRWTTRGERTTWIDGRSLLDATRAVLARLEVDLEPRRKVRELTIAQQQMVEIARGLSMDPRILVLDEPTSSLARHEADVLIATVRRLAAAGVGVVYVSHRMDEIPRVADSLTVLRDGRLVGTARTEDVTTAEVVAMMTGGVVHPPRPVDGATAGPAVLSVTGLSSATGLRDITFTAHRGEVIGLAGLLGSGRTELLRCIAGLDGVAAGSLRLDDRPFAPKSARRALRAGVGLAPEDRKKDGLALGMSVAVNLCLASPARIRRRGLLSPARERRLAAQNIRDLHIKAAGPQQPVGALSGGNQQKVVLGKYLNAGVRVLLLDEPTRGVDVEAKEQIYRLIRDLAASGASVVVASSEIEELFLVCDRVLSLQAGRIVADEPAAATTVATVLARIMEGRADD